MLNVPQQFNRNAPEVRAMAPAADTGAALMQYMCDRVGRPDLSGADVLDFGCGCRFAEAIINRQVPIGTYVGIDVFKPMIDYLRENVRDPRLAFHHIEARNALYNPTGLPMMALTRLPVADRAFDIACMFSVITHQSPEDALIIFSILRRHVRTNGMLFFSAGMDEETQDWYEAYPETPGRLVLYSPGLLKELLASAGWRIVSIAPRNDRNLPIMESLVCEPA